MVLDSATGRRLGHCEFAATPEGYSELTIWANSFGDVEQFGVEGTGAYGAGLCAHLAQASEHVVEVDRPNRQARRRDGKTDALDAENAARAVLSGDATGTPKARDGAAEALRILEVTCRSAVEDRTRAINQFKALLVTAPADLRVSMQKDSDTRQLERARRFRTTEADFHVRLALKELGRRIEFLSDQVERLEDELLTLAASEAPALLGLTGVGPHVAAQLLAAVGDNADRLTSEASMAKLCGACPIPASSGNTQRHRLNRGGDRRANNALHTIVLVRMRHCTRTRAYVARRTAEGKTKREIMRCLKRYVAREIYHVIIDPPTDIPTGSSLRERRTSAGLTLAQVANAVGSTPIQISRLERRIDHNNQLARTINDWLSESA